MPKTGRGHNPASHHNKPKNPSKQVRISLRALSLVAAEAERRGGAATPRSVIEELILERYGED